MFIGAQLKAARAEKSVSWQHVREELGGSDLQCAPQSDGGTLRQRRTPHLSPFSGHSQALHPGRKWPSLADRLRHFSVVAGLASPPYSAGGCASVCLNGRKCDHCHTPSQNSSAKSVGAAISSSDRCSWSPWGHGNPGGHGVHNVMRASPLQRIQQFGPT